MKISELEVGDILLTVVGAKPPALHAQIYAGDSHFQQTILHAVDDTRKDGPSKLMATGLKSDSILVYRCKNGDLAYEAYCAALRWIKYLVPYDQERKTLKEAYRNTISSNTNVVSLMQLLFHRHGTFRAIKYTARRDEILCYPTDGEMSRGLTCTMFIILCYQAAALEEHVLTTSEVSQGQKMVRVSDKKMTRPELEILQGLSKLNAEDVKLYREYVGLLQSGNEYSINWELAGRDVPTRKPAPRLPEYKYVPSLCCWKGPGAISKFNFAGAMTTGMMVDAKITTSEQLRLCLEADKVGWTNMGYLDNSEEVARDPEYKKDLAKYAKSAEDSRNKFRPSVQRSLK